jgi:hypothetical protein
MEMINKSKKYHWIVIGGSWLIVQIILVWLFGINDREESLTYISIAKHWAYIRGSGGQ